MHRHASIAVALIIGLITGCRVDTASVTDASPRELAPAAVVGPLDYKVLPEVSGLVASRRDPSALWLVNDSGNRAELVAMTVPGMATRRVRVTGARNRDWEDLAAFTLDNEPWLIICDVGDNGAVRKQVALHFLPEPGAGARETEPVSTLQFSYSDGPRDVEAVAVDEGRDRIYLLSKRTKPPVLYSLPLRDALAAAQDGRELTAQALGPVTTIPAPTALELRLSPKFGKFRDQPTAMDLSRDGRSIALLTYGEAYRIDLGPDQTWLEALNGTLTPMIMPVLKQAETIAWAADGGLFATSEQRGSPLIHWRVQ